MKTAQEILREILLNKKIWDSVDDNLCNCPPKYIFEAMETYAQQQSIAYHEWMMVFGWGFYDNTEKGILWISELTQEIKSSSELYQQFLTEQNK